MAWRRTLADLLADWLRLIAWAGLLVDGILISIFSVWFVWRGIWKLMELSEAWLFGGGS